MAYNLTPLQKKLQETMRARTQKTAAGLGVAKPIRASTQQTAKHTPAPAMKPVAETISTDKAPNIQQQIADVQAELANKRAQLNIQKQIEEKQTQLGRAEAAGYSGSQEIPEDVLKGIINVEDLNDTSAINVSEEVASGATESSNMIYDITSGYTALQTQMQDFFKRQQELTDKYETEKTDIQAEQKKWYELWKKDVEDRPSLETKLEEERERWNIPEQYEQIISLLPEITSLRENLIALEEKEQMDLNTSEQQGMPMSYIRGEKSLIQRQYAVRKTAVSAQIGAKSAVMEQLRGNVDIARNLVKETVNALTYDYEQKIQDYKDFTTYNTGLLNSLDSKQQKLINGIGEQLQGALELARTEKTAVMELMLSYPNSGIGTGDSLDSAVQKATEWQSEQPAEVSTPDRPQIFGTQETGYYEQVFNPETNKYEYKSVVGGTPPAPTAVEKGEAEYDMVKDRLLNSIGEDGYVNTALYGELKLEYPKIFKYLPPEELLNPEDPTAKKYFQTATKAIAPEKEEDSLDVAIKSFGY